MHNIEKHRIVYGSEGGKYIASNIKLLCRACHDYIHTKEKIEEDIRLAKIRVSRKNYTKSRMRYWVDRLLVLIDRLKRLENLNTISNILKYGYRTYWVK